MSGPADPVPSATVRLLFFAWLRERIGRAEEVAALPDDVTDVQGLLSWMRGRGAEYERAFGTGAVIRCAINQAFAQPDSPVHPGDEVAFFPPVTGG